MLNREGYREEFDAFVTESERSYVREGTGGAGLESVVDKLLSADTDAEGGAIDEGTTSPGLAGQSIEVLPAEDVCDSQGFGGDGAIL